MYLRPPCRLVPGVGEKSRNWCWTDPISVGILNSMLRRQVIDWMTRGMVPSSSRYINEYSCHSVWTNEGLDERQRRLYARVLDETCSSRFPWTSAHCTNSKRLLLYLHSLNQTNDPLRFEAASLRHPKKRRGPSRSSSFRVPRS